MDNFLYSINATAPIFLMMLLGYGLKRIKVIDEHFTKGADRFVFQVALPFLVYRDMTAQDIRAIFRGDYVLFCFVVTLVSILAIWGLTELFMKNKSEQGAFIQASYRSSAAILGLAFIANVYDDAGLAPLMIIGAVPLYNIFAMLILTLKGGDGTRKPSLGATLLAVIKNPILISVIFSTIFAFLGWHFPPIIEKAVSSIGATATPLALVSIGAGFELRGAIKKVRPTVIATFIKLVLLAAIFLPVAVILGYRNQELMAILIMLGSPATVSCYIMAKNTENDAVLTSSIIVLSTLMSSVTLTAWIYILRMLGYL